MTNLKAVFFDMDGTLLNTFGSHDSKSMIQKKTLKERYFNYKMSKLATYSYTAMEKMIRKDWLMRHKKDEILRTVLDNMKSVYAQTTFKSGAVEFLQYLQDNSIKICLCTNNAKEIVEFILDNKGIRHYFDHIITSQDVSLPKPNPQMYNKALEKVGFQREECVIFEDMLDGAQAGREAGIRVVGVYDDFNKRDFDKISELSLYMIQSYEDKRLYQL